MARPVYKYQPIKEAPDVAIGIPLPFNNSSIAKLESGNYASGSVAGKGVFAQTYTTEDQSVSNLKNLLMTRKGERIMQPNFGSNIYSILFENNTGDIRTMLKETIAKDIEYWLPYISLNDVKLNTSQDMHSINIGIHFKITSVGVNLVINIIASENEFQVSNAEPDLSLQLVNTNDGVY